MSTECGKLIDTWKHNSLNRKKRSKMFQFWRGLVILLLPHFERGRCVAVNSVNWVLNLFEIFASIVIGAKRVRVSISFVLMVVICFISCVSYAAFVHCVYVRRCVPSVRCGGCKIFCLFDAHLSVKLEISAILFARFFLAFFFLSLFLSLWPSLRFLALSLILLLSAIDAYTAPAEIERLLDRLFGQTMPFIVWFEIFYVRLHQSNLHVDIGIVRSRQTSWAVLVSIFMISILKDQITPVIFRRNNGQSFNFLFSCRLKNHNFCNLPMPIIQFRLASNLLTLTITLTVEAPAKIYIFSKTFTMMERKKMILHALKLRFQRQNNKSLWPLVSNRFDFSLHNETGKKCIANASYAWYWKQAVSFDVPHQFRYVCAVSCVYT